MTTETTAQAEPKETTTAKQRWFQSLVMTALTLVGTADLYNRTQLTHRLEATERAVGDLVVELRRLHDDTITTAENVYRVCMAIPAAQCRNPEAVNLATAGLH